MPKKPKAEWPEPSSEFLMILIARAVPMWAKLPYKVLVREEFAPRAGWRESNNELAEWLNERCITTKRAYDPRTRKPIILQNHNGFDWAVWQGCYAMNDPKVAVEFKLLFG